MILAYNERSATTLVASSRPSPHQIVGGDRGMATAKDTPQLECRSVDGFPGYRVGSDGTVWTCKNGRRGYLETWRQLKLNVTVRGGYQEVTLSRNSPASIRRIRVHRLVLETFVGSAPDGYDGCHNNGDRADNHIANLRWDTRKGNVADAVRAGTIGRRRRA